MSSTTEKPKAMDADQTPFLSDDELSRLSYTQDTTPPDSYGDGWDCSNQEQNWFMGAKYARDFYEAMISRGELVYIDPAIRGELVRRYPELFKPQKDVASPPKGT